MSIDALNWAFKLPITGPKKAVLIALANYADHNGRVSRLSIARISLISGWGERAVQIALSQLTREANARSAPAPIASRSVFNGRGNASDYVLDLTYQGQAPPPDGHVNGESHAPLPDERVNVVHPIDLSNGAPDAPIGVKRVNLMSERVNLMHPLLKIPKKERLERAAHATTKPPRTRTAIKPDWQPDEAGRQYAFERNVVLSQAVSKFRDHHLARGNLMADWSAAWRTWCANEVRFGQRRAPSQSSADAWDWVNHLSAGPDDYEMEVSIDERRRFNRPN